MRNYYTAKGIKETCPTSLVKRKHAHWELYEALVQGLPDSWRPEDKVLLLSAIRERDVSDLLSVISKVDGYLTTYDNSTPIQTVKFDRQVVCFLKKYPFGDESPIDTRAAATEKWRDAEDRCRATNLRLRALESVPSFVHRARYLIDDVLGELTPQRLTQMLKGGTHGPGQTLSSRGNRVTDYYKWSDFPYSCTRRAAPYALAAISNNERWLQILEDSGRRTQLPLPNTPQWVKEYQIFHDCVEFVDSDRVTFVPKDAKTDRPIAVGASLNMFLQLGVKSYLEERLKLVGVDLTDQGRNQAMAYAGSRYAFINGEENFNQFSTIDLASASDTISLELVRLLLPPEWFAFLDDLRHEVGDLNGETIRYEKFSAMGNGFTFPLESLIFWALTKASILEDGWTCQRKDIAVYGDDIIVRRKHVPCVLTALNWAGFQVNQEKSFVSGPFKESCGADFFKGINVRPFYLKREIETYADLYFVCNQVTIKALGSPGSNRCLSSVFNLALAFIPHSQRRYAPLTYDGDKALIAPYSFLVKAGVTPRLRKDEIRHLSSRRLLGDFCKSWGGCSFVQTELRAKPYKGRARVRLMMALDEVKRDPTFRTLEDVLHLQASAAGNVTRRNSLVTVTRVTHVPSWDGSYTWRTLSRLPHWWHVR